MGRYRLHVLNAAPTNWAYEPLTLRNVIRDVNVTEFKSRLPALVAIDLNEDQTRLVSEVAQNFIVPNRARNDPATEQARAEARSKVEPRSRDIETGQTIIRQGEVVTPLQIEALNQLNLRQSQLGWGDLGGTLLIALAAAALMGLYLWRFEAELLDRPRHLLLLLLLLGLVFDCCQIHGPQSHGAAVRISGRGAVHVVDRCCWGRGWL